MTTNENFVQIQDDPTLRPILDYAPDLSVINDELEEQALLFFPRANYYSLDWDTTQKDDLYNETRQRIFFEKKDIPMTFIWDPPVRTLKAHGIESKRDLEVSIFAPILSKFNLNPKIGDMFYWENNWFEVTDIARETHYAASNKNTAYVLFANQTSLRETPSNEFGNLYGLNDYVGNNFITQSNESIIIYKKVT